MSYAQEEVAGCTIWRISRMGNPVGFGLGDFHLRPLGIVSWYIIQMHINASKPLSALAVAEVPLDIRKNRCAKELCVIPHPGRQCKKTVDAGRRPNSGHQALFALNCL
jgi:hypothetical protein